MPEFRHRFLSSRSTLFLTAVIALSACGGSTSEEPPKPDVTPASVAATSTDTLRGPAGGNTATQATVLVKNKAGTALAGIVVTFTPAAGSGTAGTPAALTDATGLAKTTWTLGSTVGVQTMTATVGTLAPVTFRAVASVGAPATIVKSQGEGQSAGIGTTVPVAPAVKVSDANGNPLAGVTVTFAVESGGGSITGATATTNASGIATVGSWQLGASLGANTLTATVGTTTLKTTFTATATAGAAATVTLTPATIPNLSPGQTQQLTARVADGSGNVLTNPPLQFTTSSSDVATVSNTGLVTAVSSGTATITATSGSATGSVAVTVIGHPSSLTPQVPPIDLQTIPPGDVAFSRNAMLISVPAQQKILIYDVNATTQTGGLVVAGITSLLAPSRATGPAVVVTAGVTSRLTFIDPATAAKVDSMEIPDLVSSTTMTSDGRLLYALLSGGDVAAVNIANKSFTRLSLGGGLTKLQAGPGDTLVYGFTNVGILFEIDTRTNAVRQRIANLVYDDITVGSDGLFYLLDTSVGSVRIVSPTNFATLRSFGTPPVPTTIAVSPDARQVWVTHITNQVSIFAGSPTEAYTQVGGFTTGSTPPRRVSFSPAGNIAAIGNLGGWVDIVR
jgi:hypothetical protein